MERITRARVKNCFLEENIVYFIVARGDLGKAIGKGGINIKKAQEKIGKKIKVIEYSDKVEGFIKNLIYPLKVEEIIQESERVIFIKDPSKKTKSLLIGRDGKNLSFINKVVQRFFNVEVRVVN